ncbi:MAG: hypothetical protein SPG95_00590 [Bacteroidaceae bacterium]|nr:hypothetical protein [Bacteroidaceae bacterium]MDY5327483.1 hypothetical protein [Bacteroidaceae bacterium]
MKVICFIFVLLLGSILCPPSRGAEVLMSAGCLPADTGRVQRPDSLRTDTLREVVVKPDSVLQIMKVLKKTTQDNTPRTKSLGDVIEDLAPGLQDKMLHPFAMKQRKSERRKKKLYRALEQYDQAKTFNDLLDEAVKRQQLEDERKQNEGR